MPYDNAYAYPTAVFAYAGHNMNTNIDLIWKDSCMNLFAFGSYVDSPYAIGLRKLTRLRVLLT